jgi:hypothetical protein
MKIKGPATGSDLRPFLSPLDRAGNFGLLSRLCEGSELLSKRFFRALNPSFFPFFGYGELDLDRGSGSLLSSGVGLAAFLNR